MTEQLELNLWGCKRYPGAGICWVCGARLTGRRTAWCKGHGEFYAENHIWSLARSVAARRARGKCQRCGHSGTEVNHIVPVQGMSRAGCRSHQDNLELLCHGCHLDATKAQRKKGVLV